MFILVLVVLVVALFFWKTRDKQLYWKRKNVKQYPPKIPGDGLIFNRKSFPDIANDIYKMFPEERYHGIYQFATPTLIIKDPELLKQVTVKDFEHFMDHLNPLGVDREPIWTRNLISLKGEEWREMRSTLSPSFTSSKMKAMFSLMTECAEQYTKYFLEHPNEREIEFKDLATRFANDVIATCSFGINCNSVKEKENDFYMMGADITNLASLKTTLKFILVLSSPKLFKMLGLSIFSRKSTTFFKTLIADSIKMREEKNIVRPDMINLMLEAKKGLLKYEENSTHSKETGFSTAEEHIVGKGHAKEMSLTLDDMTAQALIFFFAGFDTISTAMSFMGYELAVNPDIQERLYKEILETWKSCNGSFTYDAISKMKYLDMVVSESLRKWPPSPITDRLCVKDYTIPAARPGETDLLIEKGEAIWIPIWGYHHDEKYYSNPYKFDPERFNDENRGNINPYTYFPFGLGPRNCIGSRFALMEIKSFFSHLLLKFELRPTAKTQIPLKLKTGITVLTEKGIWVELKKRETA